jgi:F-type H+-transporting ATPase subunit gamma
LIKPEDVTLVIGEKGKKFLARTSASYREDFIQAGSLSEAKLAPLVHEIIHLFQKRVIGEVIIVYTKFINSLVAQPQTFSLLPLSLATFQGGNIHQPPLIEPDPQSVFDRLVPFYIKNTLYASLIESQVSEQSARRNAMEKASDNADELVQQLQLDFNKQRQANITQEIAEIIGGSST